MAQEAEETAPAEAATAALRVCEKLRLRLSKLIGVIGFQTLLARALTLAKAESPWLGAVKVKEDGSLEGFTETASTQEPDAAATGCAALLAETFGLLVTLIGEAITLRLARDVWPDAPLEDITLGEEETS